MLLQTGACVGFWESFAQGCTWRHRWGGSFQVLCLGLGIHYKLPFDYTFCAPNIVRKHQAKLKETNSNFQCDSIKMRLAFDRVCAQQLKQDIENYDPWALFLTLPLTIYSLGKVIHLLDTFHFPTWESWYLILGTYAGISYLLLIMCIFTYTHKKHFEKGTFKCWF